MSTKHQKYSNFKLYIINIKKFIFLIFFLSSNLYALNEIELLISKGSGLNNFFLYEDALPFLNEAIRLDSSAEEAYKERALSYFELNRIELALEDYYKVSENNSPYKNITYQFLSISNFSPPTYSSLSKNTFVSLDFAQGLLLGSLLGGQEGTVEFISSLRGGFTFLWAFACSPFDVSKELIEALYEIGELIANGRISYLLEEVVPEIIECKNYWHSWSDYIKGQKLGFLIGKYSLLVFYEITSFKGGAYFFNKIKRANIMGILERYSVTKSTYILEKSAEHAKKSTLILNKIAAGSIIPHNPNVLPHVFTKKHRWNKFIQLTGNHQKDFESLVKFLENQNILQCYREISYDYGGIITYKYIKEIGGDKIIALFEVNKNNIPLLRNAWVEIGAPYLP